jgi:eukaryotic-like serine/threonine-protein kinase
MTSTREQRRNLYERLVGQTVAGRYEIVSLMGFGGMGAVYEALQRNMNRRIALKFIPSHNPITAARFEREALTVSQLRHPNTVTVFDYGQTDDGFLYLTMELLNGRTLTDVIRDESPLSPRRAIHIASQICRSLSEAHRMGIVHRDIKPDNIFLIEVDGDPDVVKVLDFGIAKVVSGEEDDVQLTGDGRIIGTPRYMSPEQILAQPVDHRSDIYSLGCIIFEMLCGAPPFQQPSTTALMISHAQDPPPPFAERLPEQALSRIPLTLEHVVRKALSKPAEQRQQSTDALREELEAALRSMQTQTGSGLMPAPFIPLSAPPQTMTGTGTASAIALALPPRRSRLAPIVIGVTSVIILAALAYSFMKPETGRDEAPSTVASSQLQGTETPPREPAGGASHLQITINTEPQGATVLEEGEVMGTTPLNLSLPTSVEALAYTLVLEGYLDRQVTIPLNREATRRQEFSFLLSRRPADKASVVESAESKRNAASNQPSPRSERPVERTQAKVNRAERPAGEPNTPSKTESAVTKPDPEPAAPIVPRIERLDDAPRPKVERL